MRKAMLPGTGIRLPRKFTDFNASSSAPLAGREGPIWGENFEKHQCRAALKRLQKSLCHCASLC
jgi:hypothetical protein